MSCNLDLEDELLAALQVPSPESGDTQVLRVSAGLHPSAVQGVLRKDFTLRICLWEIRMGRDNALMFRRTLSQKAINRENGHGLHAGTSKDLLQPSPRKY